MSRNSPLIEKSQLLRHNSKKPRNFQITFAKPRQNPSTTTTRGISHDVAAKEIEFGLEFQAVGQGTNFSQSKTNCWHSFSAQVIFSTPSKNVMNIPLFKCVNPLGWKRVLWRRVKGCAMATPRLIESNIRFSGFAVVTLPLPLFLESPKRRCYPSAGEGCMISHLFRRLIWSRVLPFAHNSAGHSPHRVCLLAKALIKCTGPTARQMDSRALRRWE